MVDTTSISSSQKQDFDQPAFLHRLLRCAVLLFAYAESSFHKYMLYFSDYIFDDWIYQQQFGSVTDLSDMEWSMYLEYLNVAPFLNDEQCSRRAYPFTTRNDRWKNGEL